MYIFHESLICIYVYMYLQVLDIVAGWRFVSAAPSASRTASLRWIAPAKASSAGCICDCMHKGL